MAATGPVLVVLFLLLFLVLSYVAFDGITSGADTGETVGWAALICSWMAIASLSAIHGRAISSTAGQEVGLIVLAAILGIVAIFLHSTSSTSRFSL